MAKRIPPKWENCPGSGRPPYRYKKGREKYKLNVVNGGRVQFAIAMCEVCGREQKVNVEGVLRKHARNVNAEVMSPLHER
jgi:hypothetical protein